MTGKITGALREQSDWAQQDEYRLGFIKNKPFYDNRKSEPLILEWDGEVGDRETMDFVGTTFVKMMNEPPSYEELSAATFHVTCTEGFEEECSNLTVLDGREQGYPFIGVSVNSTGAAFCLCFPEDCTVEGVSYKKGLYLAKLEFTESGYAFFFIDTIHFPSYTTGELKTIDPKYLPTEVVNLDSYQGELDGVYHSISEWITASMSDGKTYGVGMNVDGFFKNIENKENVVFTLTAGTNILHLKEISRAYTTAITGYPKLASVSLQTSFQQPDAVNTVVYVGVTLWGVGSMLMINTHVTPVAMQ